MDPPAIDIESRRRPPPRIRRRSRGALRWVEFTLIFTIIFAILTVLKLEYIARNSVRNHNRNIDLPRADDEERRSFQQAPIVQNGLGLSDGQRDISDNDSSTNVDLVRLNNGTTTLKFCQSNVFRKSSFSCNQRMEYLVSKYEVSVQNAKITLLEDPENGCSCEVRDRKQVLLREFSSRLNHFQSISSLPAEAIAERYGISKTDRSIECLVNGTTHIGWIPSDKDARSSITAEQLQELIPRTIFQSWKTSHLTYNVCQNVLSWVNLNPEYDYILFDDKAVDLFVQKEFGNDIFDAFNCVNTGAARCDVWRLMVIYIFGGIYFDLDVEPKSSFRTWRFGNRTVVTGRGCQGQKKYPNGCGHQWGMIYTPFHTVMLKAIEETLDNLAMRAATEVYGVSFDAFFNAWANSPFNSSYMPGWGKHMGRRVNFSQKDAKEEMISQNGHWREADGKKDKIWKAECLT